MRRSAGGDYPHDWIEIAKAVKDAAGWKCVRCGHLNDRETGHVLTVHHLDMNPANCIWWNLPALCQRCHLIIQAKVIIEQSWMLEHSEWFKPYAAGYYANTHGLPDDRDYVLSHLEELLRGEQSE